MSYRPTLLSVKILAYWRICCSSAVVCSAANQYGKGELHFQQTKSQTSLCEFCLWDLC